MPSTAPIAQATQQTRAHVSSARSKAKAIETTVAKEPASETTETLKLQVHELETNLDDALSSLDTTEKARLDLDGQLRDQTAKANKLADDYDTTQQQLAKQKVIIDQVNSHWGLGAFAYGFKVLFRHLIILAVVLIGLGIAVTILSFIFPAFGALLKIAGSAIASVFSRFRR